MYHDMVLYLCKLQSNLPLIKVGLLVVIGILLSWHPLQMLFKGQGGKAEYRGRIILINIKGVEMEALAVCIEKGVICWW